MDPNDNPLLQPEDFMAPYKDSVEDMKNHPELVSFEKLCYDVSQTDSGRKLIDYLQDNWLMKGAGDPNHPNFKDLCIWKDGLNYLIMMIRNNVRSHQQRIAAGTKA